MSWVISLVLAGLMITPAGSNLSINTSNNFVNANAPVVVSLNETERFEQTYPLNANGRVSVSNINGSITVEAWDKNEVRLEAVKTADTKETLAEVQVRIDARPDSFKVETDYGSWRNNGAGGAWKNKNHGRLEVQYRLQVPRGAVLDEVETVNGSVTISNMTNSTKASAVNGNVKATNLRGTARISTVNGTTEADFDSVSNTGRISLETVNGKVILTVPSDINATVRADSLNGQIINDFGLPVRKGEYVGRDLYGRIGTGELQIRLESVNGDLIVRRKQDGKTPNPAVNLLNQKSKADDAQIDEDVDEDTEEGKRKNKQKADRHEKVGKVNVNVREIQRAIEESQKENLRALKLSQKELERIQPELNRINLEALKDAAKIINSEEIRQRLIALLEFLILLRFLDISGCLGGV
ncbi:MAG TPA: hypothetical protein VK400_05695 [Pyrinomonadaceae bacterium]|nr:hypothetical protein [Pyrinomonadaceae bacterium]